MVKRQTRRGKGRLMPKEAALQRTARSGIQTLCKFTAFCKKNNIPPPCFAIFSVNISAFCLYLACFSLFPRAFGPLSTLTQGGSLPALWSPHLYGGFGRLQSVCLGFEVYAALESPCRAHVGEEQSVEGRMRGVGEGDVAGGVAVVGGHDLAPARHTASDEDNYLKNERNSQKSWTK